MMFIFYKIYLCRVFQIGTFYRKSGVLHNSKKSTLNANKIRGFGGGESVGEWLPDSPTTLKKLFQLPEQVTTIIYTKNRNKRWSIRLGGTFC